MYSLPIPSSSEVFEELVRDVLSRQYPSAQLHGRPGQRQNGVDIFLQPMGSDVWIGIQCKLRQGSKPLSRRELDLAVEDAKSFAPKLGEFILATTSPNDSGIQARARHLTGIGSLKVSILSWGELSARLMQHPELLLKYYPHFSFNVKSDRYKQLYGVGILVGGLFESYFVLTFFDQESEQHKAFYQEFSEIARREASKLHLASEIELLLNSLSPGTALEEFFFSAYPQITESIEQKHGILGKDCFNLALALQDCNMGINHITTGFASEKHDMIEMGKDKFPYNWELIRGILPSLKVDGSVKTEVFDAMEFVTGCGFADQAELEKAAKALNRIQLLLWATL